MDVTIQMKPLQHYFHTVLFWFVICSSGFDFDEEILGIQMKSLYQYFHWLLFAFSISYKNKMMVFNFGHDTDSGI